MAYLGGKATGSQHILKVLNHPVFNDMPYIEPFCGYCHVLRRIINKSSYTASDSNELLITLLQHIQKSTEHPSISAQEYKALAANPSSDPLKAAYAAFTYSYNGKFFAGYVGDKTRNYPAERKRYYNRLHDNPVFASSDIKVGPYSIYKPSNIHAPSIIYCDPPYEDTEGYRNAFNSSEFWNWARKMTKAGNYVFVSEYKAPEDFVCIVQKTKRQSVAGRGATRKREEVLFVHESLLEDERIREVMETVGDKYPCSGTEDRSSRGSKSFNTRRKTLRRKK